MKDEGSRRERDGMGPGDANFGEELEGSSVSRSETERSGGASPKFAASSVGGLASGGAAPDPEVTDKPKRRRFTVEYKLSLLKKADAYRHQPGKVGALLRREGVYSSTLSQWRRQREEGTLSALKPKRRGRKIQGLILWRDGSRSSSVRCSSCRSGRPRRSSMSKKNFASSCEFG